MTPPGIRLEAVFFVCSCLYYGAFRPSCPCRHQVQEAEARRKAERAAKFEEGRRLKQARSTLKSINHPLLILQ